MRLFSKAGSSGSKPADLRLFFATDLHGSEIAFRKFVNAAAAYRVDHLICGGDLAGKRLFLIVEDGDGSYTCTVRGYKETFSGDSGLADLKRLIEIRGGYHLVVDARRASDLEQDQEALESAFVARVRDRLAGWIALAKERLAGTDVRCYFTGGNDDSEEMLEPLLNAADSERVVACEGRIVEIAGHEMLSMGLSNPTPWHTPREVTEETLTQEIDRLASRVGDFGAAIFNIHVPPKNSGLDTCPALDTSTWPPKPIIRGAEQIMDGAGSVAVSEAIERYQPLVSLHGHIHESAGVVDLGRTKCINPGSEYQDGTLRGAIVTLLGDRVVGYQLTNG